jgi:hypothetical protein
MISRTKLAIVAALSLTSAVAFAETSASTPTTSASTASNASTQSEAAGGSLEYAPVTTENSSVRYAANSAFAPALTSSNDTCMGSSSLGATGMSFGVALGSTWTDKNCEMLKNSRELWNQGEHAASLALLCSDDDIRYSISVSGGVMDRRQDGSVVRLGCPMTKQEWIAAGRPLIDPSTGQPVAVGSIVRAAPLAMANPVTVASVDSHGIKTTITTGPQLATPEEARQAIAQANADMARLSAANK